MKQYSKDLDRFVELFSKFTGISRNKINKFLDYNNVRAIFEHPASLSPKEEHIKKINDLKLLRNYYMNLKSHDIEYILNSSSKAGEYFLNYFKDVKDKEKFVCSFLDARNRVIATSVMFEGTIDEAPVYPREVAKKALIYDAKNVILSHNHPGKSIKPSKADIVVTDKISKAMLTVGIGVLDHIIAGGDEYSSMAESGLLDREEFAENKVVEDVGEYKLRNAGISKKKRKKALISGMEL